MEIIYDNTIKIDKVVKKYADEFLSKANSTHICWECNSILKTNIDDIHYSSVENSFNFICPICKHVNTLSGLDGISLGNIVPYADKYYKYDDRIKRKVRDLLEVRQSYKYKEALEKQRQEEKSRKTKAAIIFSVFGVIAIIYILVNFI